MGLRRLRILLCLVAFLAFQSVAGNTYAQFRLFRRNDFRSVIPDNSQTERDTRRTDASNAYQKRDFAKALEITGELLAKDPNDFVALHLRASTLIEVGREEGAAQKIRDGIEDSRRALGLAGQRYSWLYVPYLYGLSSLANLEGRLEHAALALKVADSVLIRTGLAKNDLGSLYYQRGLCHAANKNPQAALADLAQSIKNSPELEAAYIERAELLTSLNQVKEATEAYDIMVNAFPNSQVAYNYRGRFRREQQNLDGAVADFSQAIRLLENDSDYVNRGMCLFDLNEPLAAEGDFTQAIKLNPKADHAFRLRGTARLAQGHLEGALQDYEEALRLVPGDLLTIEERAFARFFKKDFAGSAADFDKIITAHPELFRLAQWLHMAYVRSGKAAEATRLLDTRMKGKLPNPSWNLTMCNYLEGRGTEQQLLEAAKDKDAGYQAKKQCEAHYFIGQKKAASGAAEEAKAHFREAEKLESAFQLSAFRGSKYELESFKK